MYGLGWVTGTGGGVSVRDRCPAPRTAPSRAGGELTRATAGGPAPAPLGRDEIYIAPSGVQKERVAPEDLFVQTLDGRDLHAPDPSRHVRRRARARKAAGRAGRALTCSLARSVPRLPAADQVAVHAAVAHERHGARAGAVIHTHSQARLWAGRAGGRAGSQPRSLMRPASCARRTPSW